MRASEKDDASWTRNVASRTSEIGEICRGGIRLAREKEGFSRWDSEGSISSKPTHIHARVFHTHIYTRTSGCTPSRQARALQTARLPPRTFGKINRIQEKPMVRQASGALSPLPPSSFPSLSLSRPRSRSFSFSLPPSPCLFLSISLLPPFRPPTLPASRRVSHAHTRYPCSRRCSRQREGELACIHWRSTEIGGMRARTTAKDGDKDKGSEREVGGKDAERRRLCANVSDSIEASRTEKERSVTLKERKKGEKEERERRETRIVLCAWFG